MRPGAGSQPTYGVGRWCGFAMSAVTGAGDQSPRHRRFCAVLCSNWPGMRPGGRRLRRRPQAVAQTAGRGTGNLLANTMNTTASADTVSSFTRLAPGPEAVGRGIGRSSGPDREPHRRYRPAGCLAAAAERAAQLASQAVRRGKPKRHLGGAIKDWPRSGWTPPANRPPGAGTSTGAGATGRFRTSSTPPLLPSGPRPSTLTA